MLKKIKTNILCALCESPLDFMLFFEEANNLKQIKDESIRKRFYEKYTDLISIMEKYGIMNELLVNKLNIEPDYRDYMTGFLCEKEKYEYDEEYFCEYLLKHYKDIDTISDVVNNLRDLGVEKIILDRKIDKKYKKDNDIYKVEDLDIYLTGDVVNTHVCGISAILKTLIMDISKLPNKLRNENEVDEKDDDTLSLRKKLY